MFVFFTHHFILALRSRRQKSFLQSAADHNNRLTTTYDYNDINVPIIRTHIRPAAR
jgi:hypothetical protein